jgi:hypothetical protein
MKASFLDFLLFCRPIWYGVSMDSVSLGPAMPDTYALREATPETAKKAGVFLPPWILHAVRACFSLIIYLKNIIFYMDYRRGWQLRFFCGDDDWGWSLFQWNFLSVKLLHICIHQHLDGSFFGHLVC